ncbi:MAG TPA: ATP-binding protein [Ktedonobacteraceae bacterium]|nr:ATP-binding protein [Ktedonobacteraceae bacterium]
MQTSSSTRRILQNKQSYKNILYLLCAFPLGLCYFIVTITGILVGIGTLVIWVGVPILIATHITWWSFARVERQLAMSWLNVEIAPMSLTQVGGTGSWLSSLPARLSLSMTWKTLAFLLIKFLVGTGSFCITLCLLVLGVSLGSVGLVLGFLAAPFVFLKIATTAGSEPGRAWQKYLWWTLSGFGIISLSLHILDGLAFVSGQLARVLLGMSTTELRLEKAKAQAALERSRAEQAEQRRKDLVINVSHELRAPVASISGHLESLLLATEKGTATPPPTTLYNYLNIAHQEARRLGSLVDELLALARMEVGELRVDMRGFPANEVVEEVYQLLMPLAMRERQVTLVRGSQPHLPPVLADRQRLLQVLLNLARNAITSTPAGGIVSINLETASEDRLALIVADSGVGIPANELQHIFERFYRTDASRSRATGGFGLGLAIVHEMVTAMGGSISVESIVGQGSRFSVLLHTSTPIL